MVGVHDDVGLPQEMSAAVCVHFILLVYWSTVETNCPCGTNKVF